MTNWKNQVNLINVPILTDNQRTDLIKGFLRIVPLDNRL